MLLLEMVVTELLELQDPTVPRLPNLPPATPTTKLATACTIPPAGAATGTATGFDGSGNITIPVTALAASAIRAQWYAAYPDGAEAHNAMWGGRDITAAFNNGTVSANIKNGTFRDIFPGDYITKQVTISGTAYTVNWVMADCDYWINKGDAPTTAHHVVIVPQSPIFTARMNATNTTGGGYSGSEMFKNIIPCMCHWYCECFWRVSHSHIPRLADLRHDGKSDIVRITEFYRRRAVGLFAVGECTVRPHD